MLGLRMTTNETESSIETNITLNGSCHFWEGWWSACSGTVCCKCSKHLSDVWFWDYRTLRIHTELWLAAPRLQLSNLSLQEHIFRPCNKTFSCVRTNQLVWFSTDVSSNFSTSNSQRWHHSVRLTFYLSVLYVGSMDHDPPLCVEWSCSPNVCVVFLVASGFSYHFTSSPIGLCDVWVNG